MTELMNLYDQEVKYIPGMPNENTRMLRARLVLEEAVEFVESLGCRVAIKSMVDSKDDTILSRENITAHIDPELEPDLVEAADAIADILVVTYGAAASLGIPSKEVLDEVNRSNNTKVWSDGKIHKREDGKVLKPDTYSPADVKGVLDRYTEKYLNDILANELTLGYAKARSQNLWTFLTAQLMRTTFEGAASGLANNLPQPLYLLELIKYFVRNTAAGTYSHENYAKFAELDLHGANFKDLTDQMRRLLPALSAAAGVEAVVEPPVEVSKVALSEVIETVMEPKIVDEVEDEKSELEEEVSSESVTEVVDESSTEQEAPSADTVVGKKPAKAPKAPKAAKPAKETKEEAA